METTTPAPTEKMVRGALLDALRKEGLTPEEGWIAVRAVNDGPSAGMYMVVVAEHAARLCGATDAPIAVVMPQQHDVLAPHLFESSDFFENQRGVDGEAGARRAIRLKRLNQPATITFLPRMNCR
jgi:hypothetical protein